jgi:hypothetical protein
MLLEVRRRVVGTILGGAVLFFFCGSPAPAARGEEIAALYRVSYMGLPAGQIRFRFSGDGFTYSDEIAIESAGLPRLVTHFRGTATSEGRLANDGQVVPQHYDALYDLRKRRNSHLSLRFDGADGTRIVERNAADTSRKPPLADLYRRNVVDPVSALAAIREKLRGDRAEAARDFTVPVYDDARRFDVLVHVISAGEKDGIRLLLTLRPIAGFKGESSDEGDPDDAPRQVQAAFSDDVNVVPVSMRVSVWYLPLVVQFDHFCKSFEACD